VFTYTGFFGDKLDKSKLPMLRFDHKIETIGLHTDIYGVTWDVHTIFDDVIYVMKYDECQYISTATSYNTLPLFHEHIWNACMYEIVKKDNIQEQEATCAIIKPDAVKNGNVGKIICRLEEESFKIYRLQMMKFSNAIASSFYSEHKGKPFFEKHIEFMSSGNVVVMSLLRENAVNHLRDIVGNTDPKKAKQGTIRQMFGTTLPCNAIHASDSFASAIRELSLFWVVHCD